MKSIIITGAGRGLGKALFDIYLKSGWKVFPLVRNPQVADVLKDSSPSSVFPILGDLRDIDLIDKIDSVLNPNCESLDVLINNAGYIKKIEGVINITSEILEEHFKTNVSAVWKCSKAAYPYLLKNSNPRIINVSSRRGSITYNSSEPFGRAHPYKVSKCALNMLTVLMDEEFSKEGIRVLPVHPGKLKTRVAPPDADTTPETAAELLYSWIESINENTPLVLWDVVEQKIIPW